MKKLSLSFLILLNFLLPLVGAETFIPSPPASADDATLIQYALQLREMQHELFMGAKGVLIWDVAPNSQAQAAKLQRGDIVIAYAGQAVNTTEQFLRTIQANATQSQIELRFIRANTVHTVVLQGGQIGIHFAEMSEESAIQLFIQAFIDALTDEGKKAVIWKLISTSPQTAEKAQQWLVHKSTEGGEAAIEFQKLGDLLGLSREIDLSLANFQQIGKQAEAAAHYQSALELFQKGLQGARRMNHQPYIGQFLSHIGNIYKKLGQNQQALEHLQQALTIYRELKDRYGESVTLSDLGMIYAALGKYQLAVEHFQQAAALKHQIGDLKGESILYSLIAIIYNEKINDYAKALEYYQKALNIDRQIPNRAGEAAKLNDIGGIYEKFAQYQQALEHFQQALIIYRELSDLKGESIVLSNIAFIYNNKINDYAKALKFLKKALSIDRKIPNRAGEAAKLNDLGDIYQKLAQYQQALEHFHQALIIHRELKEPYDESVTLSNMGAAYSRLGKSQQALKHFQQALDINRALDNLKGQAINLTHIGNVYNILAQYPKALDFYQDAAALQHQIDEPLEESINLNNIGVLYEKIGDYVKALEYYQKGLDIDRRIHNRRGEATKRNNIGVVYNKRGESQKALEYLQQALEIRRDISNKRGESTCLSNIGSVHQSLGDYQKALYFFQQALAISREISEPHAEIANINNIGVVYSNWGQYQQALETLEQALNMSREINDPLAENMGITNIGVVYSEIGNYQKALKHFQQAFSIAREIGYPEGESASLNNIGSVYFSLGEYIEAIDYSQQALVIHRRIYDRRGESADLNNIGTVYNSLGQYDKALDFFNKALELSQAIQERRGEAIALTNIGVAHLQREQYKKALEYSQQALVIHRDLSNRLGKAIVLINIGVTHEKFGQYEEALDDFRQALAINREIDDRFHESINLINIGDVHRQMGQYTEALPFFQESINLLKNMRALGNLWYAQNGLALVKVHLNQLDSAMSHYEQALDNIEYLRAGLTDKEYKRFFMRDKFVVYDNFITLLQTLHEKHPNKGYDRKALEVFERKQGRVFLEEMGQSGARLFAGLPPEISQEEHNLENQLAKARQHLAEEGSKLIIEQNRQFIKDWEQREQEIQAKQQALQTKIKNEYPDYYALKYPQPATLTELQSQVLRPDELILVYGVMENSTTLWVIGQKTFQIFNLPLGENAIEEKVSQLRGFMRTGDKTRAKPLRKAKKSRQAKLIQASYDLYTQLLPDQVRPLLTAPRTVYVVPTGPLYALPFETLVTQSPRQSKDTHYLIEDVPIAYLSSASLLKTLREAQQHRQETAPYPLLAFANPIYQSKQFEQLSETEEEAKAIATLLKAPKDSEPLQLREAASRPTVIELNKLQRLDDYQYILFATHGILPGEVDRVTQAALVLSYPDTLGYLTMADVFALQLNAKLVSLSACNTGRGKQERGEGVMGLTRAFMYAGTPAIAVTLWSVETLSAKQLSIGFFKYLKEKPAAALREIKLRLLQGEEGEKYKLPYYWAPFVVFGDAG